MSIVNEREIAELVVAAATPASDATAYAVADRLLLLAAERLTFEELWELAGWSSRWPRAFVEHSSLLALLERLGHRVPNLEQAHAVLLRELAEQLIAGRVAVRDVAWQLVWHESGIGVFGPFSRLLDADSMGPTTIAPDDRDWQCIARDVLAACRQLLADQPGSG